MPGENKVNVIYYSYFLTFDHRFSYYTEGNSQTFKAKGDHTLKSGTVFKTEVKKDPFTLAVYAKGTASSVTFKDIMASFGLDPAILPDFFVNALK